MSNGSKMLPDSLGSTNMDELLRQSDAIFAAIIVIAVVQLIVWFLGTVYTIRRDVSEINKKMGDHDEN